MAANSSALAAFLARPGIDVSRVVHHAAQAGDAGIILQYGPVAAREASAAGAHREAAAHLRLVLDQHPVLDPRAEAELREGFAIESYTVDAPARDALAAQRRAVELRRGDDPRACGVSLRWLSRICWWAGEPGRGGRGSRRGDRRAQHRRRRSPAGDGAQQQSLRVALAADEPEHACRAYVNLIWCDLEMLRLDDARRRLTEGIEFAEHSEFLMFSRYLQMELAALHYATAAWDEVVPAAADALDGSPPVRCSALTIIGRTRLRRGEPGAVETLREAWQIAVPLRECHRVGPAAAALAEAAAFDGDASAAVAELTEAFELARRFGTGAVRAELVYWLARAGRPVGGSGLHHPYALLADGRWREAAQAWRAAGCRYEYAAALAESPETDDQLAALAVLDALGAEPLARLVRARLRSLGVARIPRGPVPATRVNPAGLTERQVEVVRLLAQGMTNAEIASQLVLSVRTVDSHVAAALEKLGARTRREAVARAGDLGLLDLR